MGRIFHLHIHLLIVTPYVLDPEGTETGVKPKTITSTEIILNCVPEKNLFPEFGLAGNP